MRISVLFAAFAIALVAPVAAAMAQTPPGHLPNLFDLKLGTPAKDLPEEEFIDFACGTDGGPPGKRIGGFTDFAKCKAEPSGLHEVYFRYDDQTEYEALAHGNTSYADLYGGTKVSVYTAIVSALFDDAGILRGLRAVNDTRTGLHDRANAYLMAQDVRALFGADGWKCLDLPASPGEEPVGNTFVKQTCSKTANGLLVTTEAHLFRRPGETEVDPITGRVQQGKFESTARIEVREAGTPIDDQNRLL